MVFITVGRAGAEATAVGALVREEREEVDVARGEEGGKGADWAVEARGWEGVGREVQEGEGWVGLGWVGGRAVDVAAVGVEGQGEAEGDWEGLEEDWAAEVGRAGARGSGAAARETAASAAVVAEACTRR